MAGQAAFETASGPLATWMAPFARCFIRPTWADLLVLAAGAILSPGRRTVASAFSSVGLRGAASFTNRHRVLNRGCWSGRPASGTALWRHPDKQAPVRRMLVRKELCTTPDFPTSPCRRDMAATPRALLKALTGAACYPA